MELSDLDLSKTYSYADYYSWTFDERVELINGTVFNLPTPWTLHQQVSGSLSAQLWNYHKNTPIQVFCAPFDVRLPTVSIQDEEILTVVQPDICIICDGAKIDERGCIGAPDIVVEILSPGDNQKELHHKYHAYETVGVSEYWIIHPTEQTFFKYVLTDRQFQPSKLLTIGDDVTTPILPGFVLSLDGLFYR